MPTTSKEVSPTSKSSQSKPNDSSTFNSNNKRKIDPSINENNGTCTCGGCTCGSIKKLRQSRTKYNEEEDLGSGCLLGRGQTIQPQTVEVILKVYQFFLKLIEVEGQPVQKIFLLSCLDDVRL